MVHCFGRKSNSASHSSSAGEYFIHKTRNADRAPRLQLIESHRINDCDRNDTEDGIGFDAYGAPSFYRVQLDDGNFRNLPAGLVLHVF